LLALSNVHAGVYFVFKYFSTPLIQRQSFITTQFMRSFRWRYNWVQ